MGTSEDCIKPVWLTCSHFQSTSANEHLCEVIDDFDGDFEKGSSDEDESSDDNIQPLSKKFKSIPLTQRPCDADTLSSTSSTVICEWSDSDGDNDIDSDTDNDFSGI